MFFKNDNVKNIRIKINIKKKPLNYSLTALIKTWRILLSHTVAHAVPSEMKGLTSLFGKGRGVSLSFNHQKTRVWNLKKITLIYKLMTHIAAGNIKNKNGKSFDLLVLLG